MRIPKFKSKEDEADFWMKQDTADFWDSFEDIKDPLEISTQLRSQVRERHEKMKLISIRIYPSQIRMAKAIAMKQHVPYQTLLRSFMESGLSHLIR